MFPCPPATRQRESAPSRPYGCADSPKRARIDQEGWRRRQSCPPNRENGRANGRSRAAVRRRDRGREREFDAPGPSRRRQSRRSGVRRSRSPTVPRRARVLRRPKRSTADPAHAPDRYGCRCADRRRTGDGSIAERVCRLAKVKRGGNRWNREPRPAAARKTAAGEADIAASMARQFSGTGGLPEDHKPAMARIRLRGWPAIRLLQTRGERETREMPKTPRGAVLQKFSGSEIGLETTNGK